MNHRQWKKAYKKKYGHNPPSKRNSPAKENIIPQFTIPQATAPQIAAALKISLTVVRKILAEEATEQTEKALDAIGAERHEKTEKRMRKKR